MSWFRDGFQFRKHSEHEPKGTQKVLTTAKPVLFKLISQHPLLIHHLNNSSSFSLKITNCTYFEVPQFSAEIFLCAVWQFVDWYYEQVNQIMEQIDRVRCKITEFCKIPWKHRNSTPKRPNSAARLEIPWSIRKAVVPIDMRHAVCLWNQLSASSSSSLLHSLFSCSRQSWLPINVWAYVKHFSTDWSIPLFTAALVNFLW